MHQPLAKRVVAEALGTFFLLAAVVGSGIMAQRLANGNAALALLANTAATGRALIALIISFAPISGAHFNPVVTLSFALRHGLPWREAPLTMCGAISRWNWRRYRSESDVRFAGGVSIYHRETAWPNCCSELLRRSDW
jgi:transposase